MIRFVRMNRTGGTMMQFWLTVGMVILGIMLLSGLSPCTADSIYDYTFNQHLWTTTININSDDDIEYYVEMPDGADFNLYVWDTWGEEWYSSIADGNIDYVIVPRHSGYQHYLYLHAYKGEGKWILSCDDIGWVEGSITDLGVYTENDILDLLNSNPEYDEYYY